MDKTTRIRTNGFSLIELLIALVFISFLMAGMLRIYGSAIQGFAAANETVKAQRDNRWAMQNVQDDISAAGFEFPNVVSPILPSIAGGAQNPVMIIPNQTITVNTPNPASPGSNTVETLTFDELQFMTDQVLPVSIQLAAVPSSPTAVSVSLSQGDFSALKPGDYLTFLDAQLLDPYDVGAISTAPSSGTSGTITLAPGSGQSGNSGVVGGGGGPLERLNHAVGADIMAIRTGQVVRYTLMALSLDPTNTSATVPCLVRDQTSYPATGALIVWPAPTATPAQLAAANVTRTVVSENVSSLRFDMSADQGKTWVRAASWAATLANLNNALANLASGGPVNVYDNPTSGYASSAQDATRPKWYRYAPMLFRVDITTRTLLKRTDYSAVANTAAYRSRTQTLLIQPQNFGLGS